MDTPHSAAPEPPSDGAPPASSGASVTPPACQTEARARLEPASHDANDRWGPRAAVPRATEDWDGRSAPGPPEALVGALAESAGRFRRAVERHVAAADDPLLRGFPAGTCKMTSLLLARHLDEAGVGAADLVANAFRGDPAGVWATHAWLELHAVTLDVTADQFGDAPAPVIVAARSPFHDGFRRASRYPYRGVVAGFRPDVAARFSATAAALRLLLSGSA